MPKRDVIFMFYVAVCCHREGSACLLAMAASVALAASLAACLFLSLLSSTTAVAHMDKASDKVYEPTWESLDSRPLPPWYDEAKFGIFIHWGIFSVPSWKSAEWYVHYLLVGDDHNGTREFHKKTYGPDFTYGDFGNMFKAELWDPDAWAQLFSDAGAKFVLFTSKHCDGWANWKSPVKWNYNSVDNGPHRDLVGELTNATVTKGMRMGLYYCNIEWGNPILPWDNSHGPVPYHGQEQYVDQVFLTELKDVTTTYKPSIIFGDYGVLLNSTQLESRDYLAWLYNESPVKDEVVVNDRWGTDTACKHGGFWTCTDKYQPGSLQPHKWTDVMTLGNTWGLNRLEHTDTYKSPADLISILVNNVAYGGNLILNVGPTADGRIIPIMQERLLQMGVWLKINGDAIYGTQPWETAQQENTTDGVTVYYTQKPSQNSDAGNDLYAILLSWPASGKVSLTAPPCSSSTVANLLTGGGVEKLEIQCGSGGKGLTVTMPSATMALDPTKLSQYAYTIRLEGSL